MNKTSSINFVNNLKKIMDVYEVSQNEIAKRSGVAQKTINNIFNEIQSPNIVTVEKVAEAFGLETWHLIMPITIEELKQPLKLEKIVSSYRQASPDGKNYIEMVAEREAVYGRVGKAGD